MTTLAEGAGGLPVIKASGILVPPRKFYGSCDGCALVKILTIVKEMLASVLYGESCR